MSWETIEDKHREKFNRDYVVCEEPSETDYIVETIVEEFPFLTRLSVEKAVDHVSKTIQLPCDRKRFLEGVANNIGRV